MEALKNPETLAAWLQLIAIGIALFAAIYSKYKDKVEQGEMNRWSFIKEIIPEVHGYVQKVAKTSKSDKAALFVETVDRFLRSVGMLPVRTEETDMIKALGSGYHQEFKVLRGDDLSPVKKLDEPSIE